MSEKIDKLRASLEKEKERRIKINNRIHVVGNGKAIDKGRSFRIENATVMLIFGNINSDTDHFIPPLYYSMLLRTTDFFALVTSF